MSETTNPETCTPWQRTKSYWKRRRPVLLALVVLLVYLYGPTITEHITFLLHGAPAIVPGGPDLDGSQVQAANQAGGWMQLGAITSKILAAAAYFCVALAVVWHIMHYIIAAVPDWAKKDFTQEFNTLSPKWKFGIYFATWLPLLFLFGLCLLAASLAQ
jgi:hypothetical protein